LNDATKFSVKTAAPITEVLACLEGTHAGIALVVNDDGTLLDTITDGDIRRAVLAGLSLDGLARDILLTKEASGRPLTAIDGASDEELLELMNKSDLQHIPVLDRDGKVVRLALLRELAREQQTPLRAMVLAGGFGKRLRPLTDDIPKPMLPVGDRPLLEILVDQLRAAGIKNVNMATHYKGDVIAEHFGDGRKFGVDISYVKETEPLGTAGALSMIDVGDEPLLVMNGDIVTNIDFRAMLRFHMENQAELTVAVRHYRFKVPFGVVESNGAFITSVSEKPTVEQLINAGIYLLSPSVCSSVPKGQSYDMTDVIEVLLKENRTVVSFPILEYWLDIGRMEDYEQAQADAGNGTI
jgi:dTDP-glucose pyrophosphorylase